MDDEFNEIVVEILSIADVRDTLTSADIPDWDSMNYLLLTSKLETRFHMSFTMDELLEAKTIGDLRKAVHERGSL